MAARATPPASEAVRRIADWAAARDLDFRHDAGRGGGAVFSRCGAWRYLLWRMGHPRGRVLGIGMLNPSTADERADDPTIARCRRIARELRYPCLLVWNLFALRATDPAALKRATDSVGPDNDAAIALALSLSCQTILAWGNHGRHLGRGAQVRQLAAGSGRSVRVLAMTLSGEPRHPLYLPAGTRPRRLPVSPPAPRSP